MKLYVVKYEDSMYPSDNRIVATTWNEEETDKIIKRECESNWDASYPNKNTSKPYYYSVDEIDLFDLPEPVMKAIKDLHKIASLVTVEQAVKDNEVCDILGLNPWAVNEGRATGKEKIDLYKIENVLEEEDIYLK